jgi:hypothetical protein
LSRVETISTQISENGLLPFSLIVLNLYDSVVGTSAIKLASKQSTC